nr:hypothetical protein Iba_chr14aCG0780 [Ipomoea batatas]
MLMALQLVKENHREGEVLLDMVPVAMRSKYGSKGQVLVLNFVNYVKFLVVYHIKKYTL